MKAFLEVVRYDVTDIVTTSTTPIIPCDDVAGSNVCNGDDDC